MNRSRDLTTRLESWMLVERYVPRYPHEWALVFRRGDEVLEVLVPEEVWRAFDTPLPGRPHSEREGKVT